MTSDQPIKELVERLRWRALIEARGDDADAKDLDDFAEVSWRELGELAALLKQAADALEAIAGASPEVTEGAGAPVLHQRLISQIDHCLEETRRDGTGDYAMNLPAMGKFLMDVRAALADAAAPPQAWAPESKK